MRKHLIKLASLLSIALAVALFAPQRAAADDDDDPPSRVARLSYAHGTVSFNPAGTDDWVSAVVNRPITTGDKLWTDNGSRAELHLGSAAIRLSSNTGFSFLNLDDHMSQIRITEGTINVRVRRLDQDEAFEIDTPNLAFSILRSGNYKINVNEAGDTTVVVVRDGEGEVTGGGSSYTVHPREVGTFSGIDQLDADVQRSGDDDDDFDHWCGDRDRREDHSTSARYVSTDVIGYEDLDDNGGWRPVPEYGTVWFPHTTVVGWAPYRYGHWAWVSPWGWTWIDDEPWGFAPFHYGRWVVVAGVWGWVPCPPRPVVAVAYVRPVYAPALVAWVGGPHFSVGIGIGGGGGVGVAWFPLGPRDVYCPSYHVSQTYVRNVNVTNTTVINETHITNVYNNVYVNKTVNVTNVTYQNQTAPNAVTATSHQAFTSAQPVARNMVKVDAREVASAPVAPLTPAVPPQQQSVMGSGAAVSARPPAAAFNRQVVAKVAPPPPPASFVKQQQVIQANGGRPPAVSQIRQVQTGNAQVARPNIKMAPPAQPAMPRNAQVNRPSGNMQGNQGNVQNRPGNVQNNPTNVQNNPGNMQNNSNRPPVANPVSPVNPGNRNVNPPANPGNPPANPGNARVYNDRPPSSRPNNSNTVDPQLEQRHQQQQEQLRQKQDQERQRVEQKQVQEQQKIQQKNADDARRQQIEQKQQQQLQQLEQKHEQEQQKLQQRQTQEHQKQDRPKDKPPNNNKPPKEEKPHK
ncbi:MAG TPA: DUF6600 domain-containing protein [Candidatus Acidoferrum sp.]|nr:DUF6600 domain-containing protein [Candidatus Acidoferrum sp.]